MFTLIERTVELLVPLPDDDTAKLVNAASEGLKAICFTYSRRSYADTGK